MPNYASARISDPEIYERASDAKGGFYTACVACAERACSPFAREIRRDIPIPGVVPGLHERVILFVVSLAPT